MGAIRSPRGLAGLACLATIAMTLAACGGEEQAAAPEDNATIDPGEAAVVEAAPDPTIAKAEIQAELDRTPRTADLQPGSDQYDQAVESILDQLLLSRWFEGEADELGLAVSDEEVDEQLQATIDEQLGGQDGYERFLEREGFSDDEVRERVRLQVLSRKIQEELLPSEDGVAPSDADTEAAVTGFFDKWRERTLCAEDLAGSRCSNGPDEPEPGPAPVP